MTTHQITIIGAGYAGVMAANQLAHDDRVTVTVVNPRADFVERIRLHQLVTGTHPARFPLSDVLHPAVELITTSATGIDRAARRVDLDDGASVGYDHLVVAAGSRGARPDLDGAEQTYDVSDWESAQRLAGALADGPPTVTVVGGGLTGIETASEIAESMPACDVRLITMGSVAAGLSPRGRSAVLRALHALGVTVHENVRVHAVEPTTVTTDAGELPSDVTVVTTGMRAAPFAAASGLTTDAHGRLVTDAALRSVDDSRIIGAGDAAAAPAAVGAHLRMSCAAAFPLGVSAGRTVADVVAGRDPAPLSAGFLVQCLSLGRRRGVLQLVRPDDRPRSHAVTGRAGAAVKEWICRSTVGWMERERRRPGSYRWPEGPAATVDAPGGPVPAR